MSAMFATFVPPQGCKSISTNPLTLALSPALAKPELALAAHCEHEDHIQLCDYVTSAL